MYDTDSSSKLLVNTFKIEPHYLQIYRQMKDSVSAKKTIGSLYLSINRLISFIELSHKKYEIVDIYHLGREWGKNKLLSLYPKHEG